jgi:hypothetical protein
VGHYAPENLWRVSDSGGRAAAPKNIARRRPHHPQIYLVFLPCADLPFHDSINRLRDAPAALYRVAPASAPPVDGLAGLCSFKGPLCPENFVEMHADRPLPRKIPRGAAGARRDDLSQIISLHGFVVPGARRSAQTAPDGRDASTGAMLPVVSIGFGGLIAGRGRGQAAVWSGRGRGHTESGSETTLGNDRIH